MTFRNLALPCRFCAIWLLLLLGPLPADAPQGWFLSMQRSLIGGRVREAQAKNLKFVKQRIESYGLQRQQAPSGNSRSHSRRLP